jgi:uncharacterized protein YbjT (DUF2867 family)
VGCGCRGRELARALSEHGHAVRGTTRDPDATEAIARAGAEAVVADPDRLATLLPAVEGVSAICWLMGSARGDTGGVAPLHGERLRSLLERLVDTPVRGFVYEGAGSVDGGLLARGAAAAREAAETYRMRVEVVESDPSDPGVWTHAMTAAVARVL